MGHIQWHHRLASAIWNGFGINNYLRKCNACGVGAKSRDTALVGGWGQGHNFNQGSFPHRTFEAFDSTCRLLGDGGFQFLFHVGLVTSHTIYIQSRALLSVSDRFHDCSIMPLDCCITRLCE